MSQARGSLRVPVLIFLSALLLQTAWILAVPPFRGSDEFDHVYRAAAVAHGQWKPDASSATRGTGAMVEVPEDIVRAAHPVCDALPYTQPVDCSAQTHLSNGLVTVASGAGRYHPLFYWLIGTPALPFEGAHAVYVMRAVTALLCASLLALAGWALGLWARTRWPVAGLLVAMTPVAVYGTAVAAPNGPEIAAAAAVWCALLGLCRDGISRRGKRVLFVAAIPPALLLVTLRSLGPVWLALIILTVMVLMGRDRLITFIKDNLRLTAISAAAVGTATALSVWWILSMRSFELGHDSATHNPVSRTLQTIPLWLLQSIAAFPNRGDEAPPVVYACCLVVGFSLAAVGMKVASVRHRRVMIAVFAVILGLPAAISVATYTSYGTAWQGRYGLPFSMGFILLAAQALDEADFRHRLVGPALLTGSLALVVAHLVSPVNLLLDERRHSPLAGTSAWWIPSPALVTALVLLGWACWLWCLKRPHAVEPDSARPTGSAPPPRAEVLI